MRTALHTLVFILMFSASLWGQNIYSGQTLSIPLSIPTSFNLTVWLLLFSGIALFVFLFHKQQIKSLKKNRTN